MDVLIAHGSEACRAELSEMLADRAVDVLEAADGARALEILMRSEAPLLALVDWDLPGLEGPELCRLMRDFHLGRPPYIILVTPAGAQRDTTAGLLAGANDFVFMPAERADVRARVEYGLRVIELPWGERSTDEASTAVRRIDGLTGVDDRDAALERLAQEVSRAQRDRASLSIGLLRVEDLDGVCDRGGRAMKDAVLREVVRRLRGVLRPYDGLGRVAGDEFLLIMPNTGQFDVGGVLERLQQAVCAVPISFGHRRLEVSAAIGGATGLEETAADLLARARDALEAAAAGAEDGVVAGRKVELRAVLTHEPQAT